MRYLLHLTLLVFVLGTSLPAMAQKTAKWPPDAVDVSYTLAAELTGQRGLSTITFAPGVRDYLAAGSGGEYNAFTKSRVAPLFYGNSGPGNAYNAEVGGSLHLYDAYNRLVSMQYMAQYAVNGKRINVTQALAVMSSPTGLSLETYMVPEEDFKNGLPASRRRDWASVYTFAKSHAYTSAAPDKMERVYLVLSFVMNRLPADARFEVVASTRKKARRTLDNLAKDKEAYLDYNGWRVHMFAAQFNPESLRQRFYCNYYYTPGEGVPEAARNRTLVASFSSKPSGTPEAPAAQAREQIQASPAAPAAIPPPPGPAPSQTYAPATVAPPSGGQGPFERGTSFLNPIFAEDAAIIQTRLKELGCYTGPIDSSFGPMTRQALDSFAAQNGLPRGQWSLKLQKILFRGSGR